MKNIYIRTRTEYRVDDSRKATVAGEERYTLMVY